jgi:hypothetical protein
MIKKLYTGLVLVAGVAIVSVVIAKVFGKKDECDCDGDSPCDCTECNCK